MPSDAIKDFQPYAKMTDEKKLEYSKYIQNKYIVDFNEYLKVLNNGRISLQKRQIVEWVGALRAFGPEVLEAGWKKWIQLLRPNFVPSIKDGIEHFKVASATISRAEHKVNKEEEMSVDEMSDFHRFMLLCQKFTAIGPISFHQKCSDFHNEMADKEKDIDAKSGFRSGAREHARLLKEAKATPEYQSVARKHEEKIIDKIEEVFETNPIYRGNKSPI